MTYKHLKYRDGEPVGSPITHTVSPTTATNGDKVFTVNLRDYNIGDELKEFQVSSTSNSINLWETQEGVNVLVNGEVVDVYPVTNTTLDDEPVENLHKNKFALNFEEDGDYTIQAVYRGNNATEMSATDPVTLHITQDSSGTQDGVYKLEFVNKNLKTLTYDDQTKIEFRLTKGGTAISGKTIQIARPSGGEPLSIDTNSKGLVGFINNNYDVGKYKLGARFVHQEEVEGDKKMVTSTYKDVEIKKATPSIIHTSSPVNLGSKLKITIKNSHNNNFPNKKVMVYVNGSPKTTKTNDNGEVFVDFKKKGTYKIKVVSTATANHKQVTESFNFKVN